MPWNGSHNNAQCMQRTNFIEFVVDIKIVFSAQQARTQVEMCTQSCRAYFWCLRAQSTAIRSCRSVAHWFRGLQSSKLHVIFSIVASLPGNGAQQPNEWPEGDEDGRGVEISPAMNQDVSRLFHWVHGLRLSLFHEIVIRLLCSRSGGAACRFNMPICFAILPFCPNFRRRIGYRRYGRVAVRIIINRPYHRLPEES